MACRCMSSVTDSRRLLVRRNGRHSEAQQQPRLLGRPAPLQITEGPPKKAPGAFIAGFVPAKDVVRLPFYPPPAVPADFVAQHKFPPPPPPRPASGQLDATPRACAYIPCEWHPKDQHAGPMVCALAKSQTVDLCASIGVQDCWQTVRRVYGTTEAVNCLCCATAPPSMAVPMSNEERFRRDMQSVLTQVQPVTLTAVQPRSFWAR